MIQVYNNQGEPVFTMSDLGQLMSYFRSVDGKKMDHAVITATENRIAVKSTGDEYSGVLMVCFNDGSFVRAAFKSYRVMCQYIIREEVLYGLPVSTSSMYLGIIGKDTTALVGGAKDGFPGVLRGRWQGRVEGDEAVHGSA